MLTLRSVPALCSKCPGSKLVRAIELRSGLSRTVPLLPAANGSRILGRIANVASIQLFGVQMYNSKLASPTIEPGNQQHSSKRAVRLI